MEIYPQKKMDSYLIETNIVDYSNLDVSMISHSTFSDVEKAKAIFHYVRDSIHHSADIGSNILTWRASHVQLYGQGICFAKSNLLVALLRRYSIPSGFCYQKLILDDETAPYLVLHGLIGAYLDGRWVRLDARGNKSGISAQFSLEKEQLAFDVRPELGEMNYPIIYAEPVAGVQRAFASAASLESLWADLPKSLD